MDKRIIKLLTGVLTGMLIMAGMSAYVYADETADDWPDDFATAKAVALNTQVSGTIDSSYDEDIVTFTTDASQSVYSINVSAMDASSLDVKIYNEFYGAGYTIDNGSFTAAAGQTTSRGYATLEKGKQYYIKISSRYGSGCRWRLLISRIPDDAGNDFKDAKKVSTDKKINGKFEVDDDVDFYAIKIPKKYKSYWIDIHNMSGSSQMMFVIYSAANDLSSKIDSEREIYAAHNAEYSYKLSPGKTYYMKIYGGMKDTQYYFKLSQSAKTIKKQRPDSFKVESNYSRSVFVSFENNRRYDGVELYRSTSAGSGFKKVKVLENEYYDYDDLKTKKKVTYYYKARYFVKEGKKKLYSKWTKVKKGSHKY